MSPRIAIIDSNTLAAVGLRQLLQTVMPAMTVDTFTTFAEFQAAHPDRYFHYFTAMNIVLENRDFFTLHRHKTIVLTPLTTHEASLQAFHTLCTSQSEALLVRSLLMLQQHAHGGGRNLPPMVQQPQTPLTRREVEVMSLVVQGCINKEIAHRLNISLATVVTHRKNIMEKLALKSVSALTIYAVVNGYVDINKI